MPSTTSWFYLGTDGASYTFTPESGCTVTVARSTVGKTMTFNGFTSQGVTVDAETGAVTVANLTTGRHIVRVEKDGVATYQVITARGVSYKLLDAEGNELPRRMPRSSPARRCSCSSPVW